MLRTLVVLYTRAGLRQRGCRVGRLIPALFFIGWLGGPQTYIEKHGHPRLRMRHAGVVVTQEMRDAWMRAMKRALDESGVEGELRAFMEERLGDVATMLRNAPG